MREQDSIPENRLSRGETKMDRYPSLAGILLIITGVFVACNIYSLIPLYSVIGKEFQIPAQQVAAASFSFTFCYAVGLLFFGTIAERIGLKQIIVSGLVFAAVTSLLVSFSGNPWSLILFRGLQGLTLASFAPVSFNYCFHIFGKQRPFWIACINAGFLCAGIIGQLISSWLVQTSWQLVYVSYSMTYFILATMSFLVLPRVAKRQQAFSGKIPFLSIFKSLFRLYGIVLTLLFSFVSFYEGLGYYFSGEEEALQWIRMTSLPGVIPALFAGLFIAQWGARRLLQFGSLLALFSIGMIAVSTDPVQIGVVAILFVAAIALLIPAAIEKIGITAGPSRGIALALYSFTLLSGASLGSVVAALVPFHLLLAILLVAFSGNTIASFAKNASDSPDHPRV